MNLKCWFIEKIKLNDIPLSKTHQPTWERAQTDKIKNEKEDKIKPCKYKEFIKTTVNNHNANKCTT